MIPMFGSERMKEQFRTPEMLKTREKTVLERALSKGKKIIGILGLSLLSTALVEGAFSREARADDNQSTKDEIIELALHAHIRPFDQNSPADFVTQIDEIQAGKGANDDKLSYLMPKPVARLSVPNLGYTAKDVIPGLDLGAGVKTKSKENSVGALVTFHFNES